MTERLPMDTGFFSWGDGTWGEVHRFTQYDHRGDFYANALCGARFKVNHVAARTAEECADTPCGECEAKAHNTAEGVHVFGPEPPPQPGDWVETKPRKART